MLDPDHEKLLRASGISDEVAQARGYFSVSTKSQIANLGFSRGQQLTPALIIPQWNVLGEPAHHQIRPDHPREVRGKVRKYEDPPECRQIIDVPPGALSMLDDPSVPLVATEGSRKADAAVSRGMCAISLNGVYGWRGRNGKGGSVALPDWELIALKGRDVIVAFDSDAMTKPEVHEALRRFRGFLEMKRAVVTIAYFAPDPSGRKCGLDDWLAADPSRGMAELTQLCRDTLDDVESQADTFDDVEDELGAFVLGDVADFIGHFVWFPELPKPQKKADTDPDPPTPRLIDAVAMWAVHTHLIDVFDFTPRLHVKSPVKRSGKSRLLEVLDQLVRDPIFAINASSSSLFRAIEKRRPTVLFDEVDQMLGADMDQDRSDLVALINGGFRRGATVMRTVGKGTDLDSREFQTFAPLALAGIGSIRDTIADRSVIIRLERRPPGAKVGKFRLRRVAAESAPLRRRVAGWAARHASTLRDAEPDVPDELGDRAADLWAPLLAIADESRGDWPERARAVAVALSQLHDEEDALDSTPIQLLKDIHETWPHPQVRVFTAHIVRALKDIDGAPWADMNKGYGITATNLARRLQTFSIQPTRVRIGNETKRGYHWDAFVGVWDRYGIVCLQDPAHPPGSPPQPPQPEHTSSDGTTPLGDHPPTEVVTPPVSRDVPSVADVAPPEGDEGELADTRRSRTFTRRST